MPGIDLSMHALTHQILVILLVGGDCQPSALGKQSRTAAGAGHLSVATQSPRSNGSTHSNPSNKSICSNWKWYGSNTDIFPVSWWTNAFHQGKMKKTMTLYSETKPNQPTNHKNKKTVSIHLAPAPQVNEALNSSHKWLKSEQKPFLSLTFHCWCLKMCYGLCGYVNYIRKWLFSLWTD